MRRSAFFIAIFFLGVTGCTHANEQPERNLAVEFLKNIDWDPDDKVRNLLDKTRQPAGSTQETAAPAASSSSTTAPVSFDVEALLNRTAVASYYVDSQTGNDKNDGKSEDRPWATLEKLDAAPLKPGTVVNLKRGSVFRGRIKARNDVTYQAYGTGEKPLLLGSVLSDTPSRWSREKDQIWAFRHDHPGFSVDVGNIIFDGGAETGVRVFDQKNLTRDKAFWFDKKNRLVKLYSEKDPRERWKTIEFATPIGGIEMKEAHGVVVKDLALRYVSGHAVSIENCRDIVVDGLDISFVGGSNLFGIINIPGVKRYGNAIEIYKSGQNILIRSNTIDQVYDAALTNQSYEATAHQSNIIYQNNTVSNSEYCFEMWIYAKDSTMKDVLVENNVCRGSGQGWGHQQRPDGVNGRNLMVFKNAAKTQNVVFRKNKFFPATESDMKFADPVDQKFFTIVDNENVK